MPRPPSPEFPAGRGAAQKGRKRGPKAPHHRGNPLGTDRLYDADEAEFMKAVERFKREKRKPFPTCSDLLAVAKSLGYRKDPPEQGA